MVMFLIMVGPNNKLTFHDVLHDEVDYLVMGFRNYLLYLSKITDTLEVSVF